MKNQQSPLELRTNIIQETLLIKEKLEENPEPFVLNLEILPILKDLSLLLVSDEKDNKETFERYAFSIFRLTTEDFEFTKSELGQELLKLSADIQNFSSNL
jgi:hypothetical protein